MNDRHRPRSRQAAPNPACASRTDAEDPSDDLLDILETLVGTDDGDGAFVGLIEKFLSSERGRELIGRAVREHLDGLDISKEVERVALRRSVTRAKLKKVNISRAARRDLLRNALDNGALTATEAEAYRVEHDL